MRILLFEYFTGSACPALPQPRLYREGRAILTALGRDIQEMPDVKLTTVLAAHLPLLDFDTRIVRVESSDDYLKVLSAQLDECDAFWPVAPETGGLLTQLCILCENKRRLLLNSSSAAVKIASGKLETFQVLHKAGVACVKTESRQIPSSFSGPCVVKPNDGAGCQGLRLISDAASIPHDVDASYVVQPYLQGLAASLSVVCDSSGVLLLSTNIQDIRRSGDGLYLHECRPEVLPCGGLQSLAESIFHAIPGLRGYFGVDIVIHDGVPVVIEVNPRLTSSYLGLCQATGVNPAAWVIEHLSGDAARSIPKSMRQTTA